MCRAWFNNTVFLCELSALILLLEDTAIRYHHHHHHHFYLGTMTDQSENSMTHRHRLLLEGILSLHVSIVWLVPSERGKVARLAYAATNKSDCRAPSDNGL